MLVGNGYTNVDRYLPNAGMYAAPNMSSKSNWDAIYKYVVTIMKEKKEDERIHQSIKRKYDSETLETNNIIIIYQVNCVSKPKGNIEG